MIIFLLVLSFIVGLLFGALINNQSKPEYEGLLLFDDSNPNKIRWILDIHFDPDDLPKKKSVTFKVCQYPAEKSRSNMQ